jgi:hypothetical protein
MRALKRSRLGIARHTTVCRSPQCAIAIARIYSRGEEEPLSESTERKSVEAQKHGKRWHDPGPTRKHAERLYVKYPLLPITEIANVLGVSRQERERAREEAIASLKKREGLVATEVNEVDGSIPIPPDSSRHSLRRCEHSKSG